MSFICGFPGRPYRSVAESASRGVQVILQNLSRTTCHHVGGKQRSRISGLHKPCLSIATPFQKPVNLCFCQVSWPFRAAHPVRSLRLKVGAIFFPRPVGAGMYVCICMYVRMYVYVCTVRTYLSIYVTGLRARASAMLQRYI